MKPTASKLQMSRRNFMAAAAAGAAVVVVDSVVFCPPEAWALEPAALKPEAIQTLIKVARDIYPHDRLSDRYYAVVVKDLDGQAAKDPVLAAAFGDGVAALDVLADSAHGARYVDVPWEADRVALLRQIEHGTMFQTVRGGLVVGLYNNKEVWPLFGYEGPSAQLGGYIHRGFDDISWL